MDDQYKYNTYTSFIYNQLWLIDHPKNTRLYSIFYNLKSIQLCSQIQFSSAIQFSSKNQFSYVNQFSYANQFSYTNQFSYALTNLTYVFDIQDIRVTGTVPLGCRPVSNGFITRYGPAGLLTSYKQSNSEHYRYGPAGLLIGVTHQYNSSHYCYLTPFGIPIYP